MILSDRYRFVFIHIPKCAGTSVRAAVLPYHDADLRFLKTVERHPDLGEIDFRHLPLALLRDLDPEAFEKLKTYAGYAILRDPFQRFRSAVSQRTKMYLGKEFAQLSQADIDTEIDRVITYLQSEPRVIAPEFIHFARQLDFVQLEGERLVHNLYPVERLDLLVAALSQKIGVGALEIGHANKTKVLRHPQLKHVLYKGSAIARRVLPATMYEGLRVSARRMLMKSNDTAQPSDFGGKPVRDFIQSHYADDIAMHKEILAKMAT